jgi:hypothetical protein
MEVKWISGNAEIPNAKNAKESAKNAEKIHGGLGVHFHGTSLTGYFIV